MMKIISLLAMSASSTLAAFAGAPDAPYDRRQALADASRHVRETRLASEPTFAGRSQVTEALGLSRFYKVGDRWVVAVSRISHGMVFKTSDERARQNRFLDPELYEFTVTKVDPSVGARIEVTRTAAEGQPLAAARVQRLVVTINNRMKLVSKEYHYRDLAQPVIARMEGPSNMPTGFDSFPVELPNFERARVIPGARVAGNQMPKQLSKLAKRKLDPSLTLSFESPDLFGRAMRVTWQRGDLWPAYVETNGGRSILVKQEKL